MREAQEADRRAAEEKAKIEREAQAKELRARTEATVAKIQEEAARRRAEADKRAAEEQDKILAAAAAEEQKFESVVVPEKAVTNGSTIRHNWKFRLDDLSLVPREYMLLNEVMVGKIGRDSEGKARIPGITFYDEPSTVKTR